MPVFSKVPDHVLWFFSTCAQTFASLVSVFGMFVLYRLQIEEGRIGALRDRMIHYESSHSKLPFDVILERMADFQKKHETLKENDQAESIQALLRDYAGATGKRAWLSRYARRPVIELILLTFWSLAGIVLYPYCSLGYLTRVLWLTLVLSIVPLYQVARIVSVSLSHE